MTPNTSEIREGCEDGAEVLSITAKQIARQLACSHFDWRRNMVVQNAFFAYGEGAKYESDILVLRPSGWLEEVEIKVSVADFRRDFTVKEEKHRRLREGYPTLRFSKGRPGSEWFTNLGVYDPDNPSHVVYGRYGPRGTGAVSSFLDWSEPSPGLIRKFWFAMPEAVYEKVSGDIPEPYGVIVCQKGRYSVSVSKVREAQCLKPTRKLTAEERIKLTTTAYYRYWQLLMRDRTEGL